MGVLPRAKDVEIAKANTGKAIGARERDGIDLIDHFAGGIRGKRLTKLFFYFGQAGFVPIDGAAGGEHESRDLRLARGEEQVEEPGDVALMSGQGIFNRARH